mmetsp:Transcript_18475/g.31424  ORF Transcript_18475/g.31424 Transcript_18475/m.31424 type:complete len:111 (+) Transcript_18475:356-688(+)
MDAYFRPSLTQMQFLQVLQPALILSTASYVSQQHRQTVGVQEEGFCSLSAILLQLLPSPSTPFLLLRRISSLDDFQLFPAPLTAYHVKPSIMVSSPCIFGLLRGGNLWCH